MEVSGTAGDAQKLCCIARVLGKDEFSFYFSSSMSFVAINASMNIVTVSTVFEVIAMKIFATSSISLLLLQLMIQACDKMD